MIQTLAERLQLGGYTRRRIGVSFLPYPVTSTRETFKYTWLDKNRRPLSSTPGPDMHLQLVTPDDFGTYYVRIEGTNSGYEKELSTHVKLDGEGPGE
ncbi:unnamed protein product [Protopolystoma xenopodis]|uniref:Uncharacterized protein n=1 Tax=Protopolystoma xenopodis TaxID=117903 RepID=A0A3S5A9L1_9PLAT|nr:unnamed protein product [Protopolystoma xenopodis]